METDPEIQQFVNQFVETPETEDLIGSMYLSTCLNGFREKIMGEMYDDLSEYYGKNKITEQELNALFEKYISEIPPEILMELNGEIIRFIQQSK